MKKVLVTGAKGFLGSGILEQFLKNGYTAEGWDLVSDDSVNKKIRNIDMRKEEEVLRNLKILKPDIIIHCAGFADVGKSVQYPAMDYQANVTLTHHLLFGMYKLHMEHTRFVFLSSAGVYGNPVSLPVTEDMPLHPLSPYALHKVMCEDICNYFICNYGMDIKIARIFSAYGKGLKKQIFWDMYHKFQSTGRLDMFGTGSESRDYIHIEDVIQALFLLATEKSDQIVFNVANGEEVTIRQAAEIFATCTGIDKNKISFNGMIREGDPLNWAADISRMTEIGYKKQIEMEDGIKDYYSWVKKCYSTGHSNIILGGQK